MFPNILDNAIVYFYTQKGDYGSVSYDNGKIEYIYYLVILLSVLMIIKNTIYFIVMINLKSLQITYLIVLKNVRIWQVNVKKILCG